MPLPTPPPTRCDLLVIGGGINGAGIARDAAGRGLSVVLVEADDLAAHTSSASTKLVHGGLRYLEYYELRLVRESLRERARLLRIAPHIAWPLRFVLPRPPGGRPGWLIRLGLFLYDHIGGHGGLPRAEAVRLAGTRWGAGLKPTVRRGFAYSDGWVDDARLVVLNARDAADRGAAILTRTRFAGATHDGDGWRVVLEGAAGTHAIAARAIVNSAGPWVHDVLGRIAGAAPARPPRLVKGSHIVVPRLFAGDHAFLFQNVDRRIVFAIPYEGAFTLIGTTDQPWSPEQGEPTASAEEVRYLCDAVNAYAATPIAPGDVVHSFAGVRPLYDDGHANASAVTRDYVLHPGGAGAPALVSVFGGKITTYRRLAERVLDALAPDLPGMGAGWTATATLPGGDLADGDAAAFAEDVRRRWPFLSASDALRLSRAYGARVARILGDAAAPADLGEHFGGGLHAAEVDYLVAEEWARTADDILWRRTKVGLHTGADTRAALAAYLEGAAP